MAKIWSYCPFKGEMLFFGVPGVECGDGSAHAAQRLRHVNVHPHGEILPVALEGGVLLLLHLYHNVTGLFSRLVVTLQQCTLAICTMPGAWSTCSSELYVVIQCQAHVHPAISVF